MGKTIPFWIKATLLLVGVQVAFHLLKGPLGGMIGWYLISLEEFAQAQTGFFPLESGFELIIRLDALGLAAALSLTYQQIVQFLMVNALMLLLLAPLKIGVLERFWLAFRGRTEEKISLFRWYTKPKLFVKSVTVSLLVDGLCRLVTFVALLPGMLFALYLYGGSWMGTGVESVISLLALFSLLLTLGGSALGFLINTSLYPVIYCLVAQPDYSVKTLIVKGLASIKGKRLRFFGLRLGFLPWYILSTFSYGAMDFYILPYLSFTSFVFLREVAQWRQRTSEEMILEQA